MSISREIVRKSPRTVLLVDDDANVIASVVRLLRQEGCCVLTANGAESALDVLSQENVDVIVTDQRMPGMTGVELLEKAKILYPDTIRILLSGHADIAAVTDAVNKGAVYKYLTKPWDNHVLRMNIEEAFQQRELMRERAFLAAEIQRGSEELARINRDLMRAIEEKNRLIEEARYYDQVTGLPNRLMFLNTLQKATHLATGQKRFGLFLINLDRFKVINESLGHDVGDALLKVIASRLQGLLRPGEVLARVGGDEFALIVEPPEDGNWDRAASRIATVLADAIHIDHADIFATASVGMSIFPDHAADCASLVRFADAALYSAKEQGRAAYRMYSETMTLRAKRWLDVETGLRRALARGEFVLFYQPQLSLTTGKIIGVEALIRWNHPEWGMVSPAEFIPVLEESGLIVPVGEWVLRTAFAQQKQWLEAGLPPLVMSANLSALQFREGGLVEIVERLVLELDIDPKRQEIELELTESLLMHEVGRTIEILSRLSEMGIRFAVDDFGTGYSSLSYLKRFPIHTLKIDQSFVRDLNVDDEASAIVGAIIALGHSLKLKTIAEGVETAAQMQALQKAGCDEMQGYFFSRPVPAHEIEHLLRERKTLELQGEP